MVNKALFSSSTPEHLTPPYFLNLLSSYWKGKPIDLDPCADATNNTRALRYYTKEDDGLSKEWSGLVYVNPPYGREIKKWVKKAIDSTVTTTEIVLLLPSRTDTEWFHMLHEYPCCLLKGRLKFINNGNTSNAPFPSVVFSLVGAPWLLDSDVSFSDYWSDYGRVCP